MSLQNEILKALILRAETLAGTGPNEDPSKHSSLLVPDTEREFPCPKCGHPKLIHRARMLLSPTSGTLICGNPDCGYRNSVLNHIGQTCFSVTPLSEDP